MGDNVEVGFCIRFYAALNPWRVSWLFNISLINPKWRRDAVLKTTSLQGWLSSRYTGIRVVMEIATDIVDRQAHRCTKVGSMTLFL
nr:aconitate hydratase [Tanacetum cinerariifolium]